MKKLMTLEQIASTPVNEYISTQYYDQSDCNMYCPFCGKRLVRHSQGWGRDKMTWYDDCICAGAKAAEEHNTRRKLEEKTQEKQNIQKENVSRVLTSGCRYHTFAELVALLQSKGLYVSHKTFGEAIDIDGIMIFRLMHDMHMKLVVIDDNTTFASYNWDLCVSFVSEHGTQNPIMSVVEALSSVGRPFQHVIVTDIEKTRSILQELF